MAAVIGNMITSPTGRELDVQRFGGHHPRKGLLTYDELAEFAGVGHSTIEFAQYIWEVDQTLVNAVMAGTLTVKEAWKQLQVKQAESEANQEKLNALDADL